MANIGTLTVIIDGETFKLRQELKRAERQVKGFTKKTSSGFKTMKQNILSARSAIIAFGFAGGFVFSKVFGDAIKEAGNFQEQLGAINSLISDSNLVFGEFAEGVRGLSTEFGKSKEDLTKGLKDIIDATIPASEAMDVLRQSTKLSVGGFTDVKTSTSALISVFQLYRNELKDVEEASDFLFATQVRGRLTLEDLAKNIGSVIGVAKSAGVSLEDLGQGFTAISRVAGSASKTATQFRSLIDVFTKVQPIESQRLAFEKFGVTLNSTSIANEGLIKSVLKFKDAAPEDLRIIFRRSRAFRGATAIILQHKKSQDDLNALLGKTGITGEKVALALQLYNTQLRIFSQNIIDIKLAFGQDLIPVLVTFTNIIVALKKAGLLTSFLNNPIATGARVAIEGAIDKKLAEAKALKEQADIFLDSGGNLADLREDIPRPSEAERNVIKEAESNEITFKNLKKRFDKERNRITLSTTEFQLRQFKIEADDFKILVSKGLASAEEFKNFRIEGINQIELANNKTFQAMANAAKSFGDEFADTMTDMAFGAEVTFKNIAESFTRMLLNMVIKTQLIQPILGGLFGEAGGGTGSGLLGNFLSGLAGGLGGLFGGGGSLSESVFAGGGGVSAQAAGINPVTASVLDFEHGGVVPGRMGQAVPIIAHGGEEFLGAGQSGNNDRPIELTVILRNPIDPAVFKMTDEEVVSVVTDNYARGSVLRKVIRDDIG